MNVKRLLPVAALAAVAALAIWGLVAVSRPRPVVLQGQIEAREVSVAAKVPGRVAEVLVREGDQVSAGQPLFRLGSPEIEAKVSQASAVRDAARAVRRKADRGARPQEIAAAKANWERAEAGAGLAKLTFERLDALARDGVLAPQKRDEAEVNARASADLARAARAQYEMALAGARPEDREAAAAQERQAEGAVAEASAYLSETTIAAPMAGEVASRLVNPGEIAPAGFAVLTLVDLGDAWVVLQLKETELAPFAKGKSFTGKVPGLGGQEVRFEVYYVSPLADFATWKSTQTTGGHDVRTFEVRARPSAPIPGLRPGMSVLVGG